MTDQTDTAEAPAKSGPIPYHARIDVIAGAVLLFFAVLTWFGSVRLDMGEISYFGPGMMPRGLAIALFATGAVVFLNGLRQPSAEAERFHVVLRPPALVGLGMMLFALFIRGGTFWILTTPQLGMLFVGPVTVIVAGFATPEANPRELVVLGFGLTAAALLVFVDLLGVNLPVFPGFIERAIPPSFGHDNAVRIAYVAYGVLTAALFYLLHARAWTRHAD